MNNVVAAFVWWWLAFILNGGAVIIIGGIVASMVGAVSCGEYALLTFIPFGIASLVIPTITTYIVWSPR